MQLRNVVFGVLFLGCVAAIGCTPTKQVEWDVQLGKLVDNDIGYYSYISGLDSKNPDQVCLGLAKKSAIEGLTVFNTGGKKQKVYPSLPYFRSLVFANPQSLDFLFEDCASKGSAYSDTLEIGYFEKIISINEPVFNDDKAPSHANGVSFSNLTDEGKNALSDLVQKIRIRAAIEGADEVVDLVVILSTTTGEFTDGDAVFIAGRAVAFGTIEETHTIESRLQILFR